MRAAVSSRLLVSSRFCSMPLLFDGATAWTLGAFYKTSEEDLLRQYTYASGDFTSVYEPTTKAVYLQTESTLTNSLTLVAGLRVENYGFDYSDNNGLESSHDTTMTGGKVALQYTARNHFYYASISRGLCVYIAEIRVE